MKNALIAGAIALSVAGATGAQAATMVSSSADAASVDISVANVAAANVIFADTSGTAPPAYNHQASVVTINQSAALGSNIVTPTNEKLTSGVASSRSNSIGVTAAKGASDIANANFALSLGVIPANVLGISADALTSTTTAGVMGGALYSMGDSTITNLAFDGTLQGLAGINGSLYAHADPNTVLLNALGIKITLNEQQTTTSATGVDMFTNALHVSLNNYLLNGQLLNGDVILGHSQAAVTGFMAGGGGGMGTPEPLTWAMLIAGFGMVGAAMRRRAHAFRLVVN